MSASCLCVCGYLGYECRQLQLQYYYSSKMLMFKANKIENFRSCIQCSNTYTYIVLRDTLRWRTSICMTQPNEKCVCVN